MPDTQSIPILAPIEALDFHDAQHLHLPQAMNPLEAWDRLMADPLPGLATAMRLRDVIAGWFGVPPIRGFSRERKGNPAVGDKLDFFLIERLSEREMVLTVRDSHLDVMTSVTTHNRCLTITSSVVTHNWFGRLYMVPVGPAHRVIVWSQLRRLGKKLAAIKAQ